MLFNSDSDSFEIMTIERDREGGEEREEVREKGIMMNVILANPSGANRMVCCRCYSTTVIPNGVSFPPCAACGHGMCNECREYRM